MKRRVFLKSLSALTASLCLPHGVVWGDERASGQWVERMHPAMGSFVAIAVFHVDLVEAQRCIDRCFQFIDQKVKEISTWSPDSFASQLNQRRLIQTAESPTLSALLELGEYVRQVSGGSFNHLTLGLTALWRAAKEAGALPTRNEIDSALRAVQRGALTQGEQSWSLLGGEGVEFGGIGKGFIADLACNFLKSQGVRFGRIACSGDIRFWGDTEWYVDIEDPRSDSMLGTVRLHGDIAISSSGDYRNTWFVNGRRYHHLIDLHTGMPGIRSQQATVVAPTAGLADGLASALFLQGTDRAITTAKRISGVHVLLVDEKHQIAMSQEFVRSFRKSSGTPTV